MHRTLFLIPEKWSGLPVFGFGWVLGIWGIAAIAFGIHAIRRDGWNDETRGLLGTFAVFGVVIAFVLPWLQVSEDGQSTGLAIRGYGVFMLLGVVSGALLAAYRAKRAGWDPDIVYSLAGWCCAFGLLGARLFYVVQFWDSFRRDTLLQTVVEIVRVTDGGLVVYGSFFGGIIGLLLYATTRQLPPLALMDLAAPSLMLGVGFGRLGCLMNGCCFGGVCQTDLPGIQFPKDSPAYTRQMEQGMFFGLRFADKPDGSPNGIVIERVLQGSVAETNGLKPGDVVQQFNGAPLSSVTQAYQQLHDAMRVNLTLADGKEVNLKLASLPPRTLPVHPVQIYSSVDGFLICLVALAYVPFRRRYGEVTALVLMMYAVTRFIEEIVRDDQSGVWGTPFSIAQVISMGLIVSGALLLVYVYFRGLAVEN